MTYEEYKTLAENPQLADVDACFILSTTYFNPDTLNCVWPFTFESTTTFRHLFRSYNEVHNAMPSIVEAIGEDYDTAAITIVEQCYGLFGRIRRWWLYDGKGILLDKSMISDGGYDPGNNHWEHFRGRDPETLRFKVGDIVETCHDGSCTLGIVASVPPSIKRAWELESSHDRIISHFDDTDDCYTIIEGPDGDHQHCCPLNVFKPHLDVPDEIREKLVLWLKEW